MRRSLGTVAAILLSAALAPAALAQQNEGFSLINFEPPTDPFGYGVVNGARSLEMSQLHVALFYDWAERPLDLTAAGAGFEVDETFREVSTLHLTAGFGLLKLGEFGGIQAGVVLPLVLDTYGVRGGFDPRAPGRQFDGDGLGDLRTDVKVTFFDRREDAFGLAVRVFAEWPTGDASDLRSENDRWSPGATLIIEKKIGYFRAGAEVGWQHFWGDFDLGRFEVDDKFRIAGGLAVDLEPIPEKVALSVFGEIHHTTRSDHPWSQSEESPTEVAVGIKLMTTVFAVLGVSAGAHDVLDLPRGVGGIGEPDARIFGAIGLTF